MNKITTACAAAALSFAMAPAFAQDDAPVLTVDGDVMVSVDGEFVTAGDGQALTPGQSLMVQEGSVARVTYDNGCFVEYTEPATYTVDVECVPPLAVAAAGNAAGTVGTSATVNAGMTAAIVGGVVVLTAAAIEANLDGDPVPPISP